MPRVLDGRLSPGQLAALRLAANGMTSRQIAVRLRTTERGIHLRLTAATNSLGANSRTHAVAVALRLGLLDLDDIVLPEPLNGRVPQRDPAQRWRTREPEQAREGP